MTYRPGERRARKSLRIARDALIVLVLSVYLFLGFTTLLELTGRKPLPGHYLQDFHFYARAYRDALAQGDPYLVRDIGPAFLYPPPALLFVAPFAQIKSLMPKVAALGVTNIVLVCLMTYGVARRYDQSVRRVWWWFPLVLGFAPVLETLLLGQINVITHFGVFLMLFWQQSAPVWSGAGLALGIATKVTPVAFIGYLAADRNLKAIGGALVGGTALGLIAGWAFGWRSFYVFIDVFRELMDSFPLGPNVHSFGALLESHTALDASGVPAAQQALTIYLGTLFLVSALSTYLMRESEPLFIVLGLGLTLMPNVVWYHHYAFFLLPLLVWMAWSDHHPLVVAWCVLGLTAIQVDRLYSFLGELSHGAMAHGFGHLTILLITAWQIRHAVLLLRHHRLGPLLAWWR